jgi:drug/metabolite transporter (DMT)-like permease
VKPTNVGQRAITADNTTRAVVTILVSSLSFALVGVMVRLAGDLPVYEKVFVRSAVSVVIAGVMAARSGENPFRPNVSVWILIVRGIFGTVAMILYFYAIDNLTLADATVLNKLSPFFVVLFAVPFLHERLTRYAIPTLAVAFVGAALVMKPQFDLSPGPAVGGLFSAVASGAAYTVLRSLRGAEPPYRIVLYFAVVSCVAMVPPILLHYVPPSPGQFVALLGAGVFATTGQLTLTLAYHQSPATKISIYNYAHVIFAFLMAWALWGELPDRLSILGGLLIIAAAVYNHLRVTSERVPPPA